MSKSFLDRFYTHLAAEIAAFSIMAFLMFLLATVLNVLLPGQEEFIYLTFGLGLVFASFKRLFEKWQAYKKAGVAE